MKEELNISKDIIYDLYITKNLRRTEVCEILNISEYLLKKLLKEFNIKKDISKRYELSRQTKLEKYGNTCNMQSKESIDKRNKTMLERYGSISAFKDKEVYDKRNKTMLERYGVKYIMQTEEGKSKLNWNSEKQRQTMLEQYGVDNGFKLTEEIQKTKLEKYGNENYNNKAKQRQTMINKYGDSIHQSKASITLLRKYGVKYACLTDNCIKNNGKIISKINRDFAKLLKENNIDTEFEYKLDKYSFDLHILNTNILIEINPTYTHNSTVGAKFSNNKYKKPVPKDYHFNKCQYAISKGYQLISIFDWMNIDKIIDIIKAKMKLLSIRISAHKCKVKEISQKEANIFLDKYHIQGKASNQSICIGLFYNNELVQVQTFGKPRYNNKVEYEAIRLASKSDTYIVGGVSKGFNYFVKKYDPKSIISYNSLNISQGYTDDLQGFKFSNITKSQGVWVNTKNNNNPFLIRNSSLRTQGIDRLLGKSANEFPDYDGTFETSNEALIIREGYVKVYDCGNVIYLWTKD